jgi:hypothetical protein
VFFKIFFGFDSVPFKNQVFILPQISRVFPLS